MTRGPATCVRSDTGAVGCTDIREVDSVPQRTGLVTPPGLEGGVAAIRLSTTGVLLAVTRDGRLLRASRTASGWGAATPVMEAGRDVRRVAADDTRTCVLTTADAVRCWGEWYEVPLSAEPTRAGQRTMTAHGPRIVPNLPASITDLEVDFSELRLRTADGRVHGVPTDGLTHPARQDTQVPPFRVPAGVSLHGCVPTLDDPSRLQCLGYVTITDSGPAYVAGGPVVAVSRSGPGTGFVILADGRVQWADELLPLSSDATSSHRFVLGFGE